MSTIAKAVSHARKAFASASSPDVCRCRTGRRTGAFFNTKFLPTRIRSSAGDWPADYRKIASSFGAETCALSDGGISGCKTRSFRRSFRDRLLLKREGMLEEVIVNKNQTPTKKRSTPKRRLKPSASMSSLKKLVAVNQRHRRPLQSIGNPCREIVSATSFSERGSKHRTLLAGSILPSWKRWRLKTMDSFRLRSFQAQSKTAPGRSGSWWAESTLRGRMTPGNLRPRYRSLL